MRAVFWVSIYDTRHSQDAGVAITFIYDEMAHHRRSISFSKWYTTIQLHTWGQVPFLSQIEATSLLNAPRSLLITDTYIDGRRCVK